MINPFYFFISLGVGLLFVYILAPKPEVVVKFPSPYNAGKINYRDKHDNCYVIEAESVACPLDKKLIKPQPLID
jgi:hypothetical protein